MQQIKLIAYVLLAITLVISISFFYYGVTTKIPYSIDYNIPVAKSIFSGQFLHKQPGYVYIYSPGASHTILAGFMALGIPLNLYGLLSWIILFFVCKKLGDVYGLNRYMAIIFAASICMTISVIRTIGDQSIDKWLCTWFILSMILLEKPKHTLKYSLFLGFSLGMLIGTKYSGPLFFLALVPIYWKTFLSFLNPLRLLILSTAFTFFGLFWYIRNYIIEGNPYYPANIPFFKGVKNFTQQDWEVWRIPIEHPQGIIPLLNAYLSEYMIWAFSGFVIIWYFFYERHHKHQMDGKIKKLALLGITTGLASLMLPIAPPVHVELFHTISNMRYIYIFMVILILCTFLIANKLKKEVLIAMLTLLNALPLFSFIPFQPKIFLISIVLVFLFFLKSPDKLQKM